VSIGEIDLRVKGKAAQYIVAVKACRCTKALGAEVGECVVIIRVNCRRGVPRVPHLL
jgi:hypothetical protein